MIALTIMQITMVFYYCPAIVFLCGISYYVGYINRDISLLIYIVAATVVSIMRTHVLVKKKMITEYYINVFIALFHVIVFLLVFSTTISFQISQKMPLVYILAMITVKTFATIGMCLSDIILIGIQQKYIGYEVI